VVETSIYNSKIMPIYAIIIPFRQKKIWYLLASCLTLLMSHRKHCRCWLLWLSNLEVLWVSPDFLSSHVLLRTLIRYLLHMQGCYLHLLSVRTQESFLMYHTNHFADHYRFYPSKLVAPERPTICCCKTTQNLNLIVIYSG
jgi:hypothetical protein